MHNKKKKIINDDCDSIKKDNNTLFLAEGGCSGNATNVINVNNINNDKNRFYVIGINIDNDTKNLLQNKRTNSKTEKEVDPNSNERLM